MRHRAMLNVDLVPEQVVHAFKAKPALSLSELAQAMRMDAKTLRGVVKSGQITYVKKGTGLKHPRRTFTLVDVVGYYSAAREREECRSTGLGRRKAGSPPHTSTTISGSVVEDFTALRERRRAGKPLR